MTRQTYRKLLNSKLTHKLIIVFKIILVLYKKNCNIKSDDIYFLLVSCKIYLQKFSWMNRKNVNKFISV